MQAACGQAAHARLVSPSLPQCCRQFTNGTRCPPPDQPPCSLDPDACQECTTCFAPGQLPGGRPGLQEFQVGSGWVVNACLGRGWVLGARRAGAAQSCGHKLS